MLDELWLEHGGFFAYHPTANVNIHNANLLGALCVYLGLGDDRSACDRVRRAIDVTLAAQAPDGGFPYGDGKGLEWRDSFHTGFVLRCLIEMDSLDPAIEDAVRRGAGSYLSSSTPMAEPSSGPTSSIPRMLIPPAPGFRPWPCSVTRGVVDPPILARAVTRTVKAGIRDGHAVARRYRWGRTTTQYLRWCDAHVALGLADAALALGS